MIIVFPLSIVEVCSVAKDSRSIAGGASRGVLGEIDARLAQLDEQLSAHEQLLAERDRLRRARATLTGESPLGRISRDDVASYLAEHPGARHAWGNFLE